MVRKKTLEEKVAGTILQESAEVVVNGRKYAVKPLLAGTLIRISSLISLLPKPEEGMSYDKLLKWALSQAGCLDVLAEIAALGVLNSKNMHPIREKRDLLRFWKAPQTLTPGVQQLKQELLYSMSPKQISTLIMDLIGRSGLADFFGVMVSLGGVNLLKETGTNETTASGQSLEEW